jgi:hypothetical protein
MRAAPMAERHRLARVLANAGTAMSTVVLPPLAGGDRRGHRRFGDDCWRRLCAAGSRRMTRSIRQSQSDGRVHPPDEPNQFTGNASCWAPTTRAATSSRPSFTARASRCFVGFSAVLFAMVLGIALGLVAGYARRLGRQPVIMRIADVQLSFPSILIALLIFGVARGFIPPECATRWRSGC